MGRVAVVCGSTCSLCLVTWSNERSCIVGTWGAGPFSSDLAQDLLEELSEATGQERLNRLKEIINLAIRLGDSSEVAPEEVIAACTILAYNTDYSSEPPWVREEVEEFGNIDCWLPRPVAGTDASSALRALDSVTPSNGWWLNSWAEVEDRGKIASVVEQVRESLQAVVNRG